LGSYNEQTEAPCMQAGYKLSGAILPFRNNCTKHQLLLIKFNVFPAADKFLVLHCHIKVKSLILDNLDEE